MVAPGDEPWWLWLLVLLPICFNALLLAPELLAGAPSRNDRALHALMIQSASDALRDGTNVLDFWIPQLDLGFPQFLYYQHLPHLSVVALQRVLMGAVTLDGVMRAETYLLLVCFPLTVAWSMRRLGISLAGATIGAAAASLFSSTVGQYGFEYDSYVWRGLGLFTQLWAMHLSFIAVTCVWVAVNEGRWYVRTAIALASLLLSHVLYGTMMVGTATVVVLVSPSRTLLPKRVARLVIPGLMAIALTSYFWWPFLRSAFLYVSSRPDLLRETRVRRNDTMAFVNGDMFDYARLPVLTLLVVAGAVMAVVRRDRVRVFAVVGFAFWMLCYLNPPMGPLRLLLHDEAGRVRFRLIGAVHLFGTLLIGVFGDALWRALSHPTLARALPAARRAMVFGAIVVVLVAPALLERHAYYTENTRLIETTRRAIADDHDLSGIITAVAANRGGRINAGPPTGWGGTMRVGENSMSDMLNAEQLPSIGAPMQELALNSALLRQFPVDQPALYDAYDVRTAITPTGASVPPFFGPLFQVGRYTAWRIAGTGIATFVAIDSATAITSHRTLDTTALRWFTSDAPRARHTVRLRYGAHESLDRIASTAPRAACVDGRIDQESVHSQRITFHVACPTAGVVEIKQTYHPHWRVLIDGAVAATYMVAPGFLAFDTPPGAHHIDAQYVPDAAKLPLVLFGLIVLAVGVVFRRRLQQLTVAHDMGAS